MCVRKSPFTIAFLVSIALGLAEIGAAAEGKHELREGPAASGPAIMWNNPVDIETRDLLYGTGGKGRVPQGTFTFVKEDLKGSSPKLIVKDQDGLKWKVKMGLEARPETVASRIVWAVGYYADEDYFVPELQVRGLPARLHRGQQFVGADGSVHNVRLKRLPGEKD